MHEKTPQKEGRSLFREGYGESENLNDLMTNDLMTTLRSVDVYVSDG